MSAAPGSARKAAIVFIWLHDVEGNDAKISCEDFDAADRVLREWSNRAPEAGRGYNKCDVKMKWSDGTVLGWRYDLQHWSVRQPALREAILHAAAVYTGRSRALGSDEPRYRMLLAMSSWRRQGAVFEHILEHCDLGEQGELLRQASRILAAGAGRPAATPPTAAAAARDNTTDARDNADADATRRVHRDDPGGGGSGNARLASDSRHEGAGETASPRA